MLALPELSQNHSGMKEPQDVSGPSSYSEQSPLWGQTKLLKALSSQVSKRSKGEDYMASQDNLLKCLDLLRKQLPLLQFMPFSHHTPLWRVWLHPLQNHPIGTGGLLKASAATCYQGWTSPHPLGSLSQGLTQGLFWWPSTELTSACQCLSCTGGPKPGYSTPDAD